MKYLLGSKEEFWKFVDSINDGKVAIISHNDLDGVASVIFLQEILKSRNIKTETLFFIPYKVGMFDDVFPVLEDKKITKVFFTDMYIDGGDIKGFEKIKNNFNVFTIDHHPIKNKNEKNIIKTDSYDCSALTIFDLGKEIIDKEKWKWLLYSAVISDVSYKKPENFEMIKKDYPDLRPGSILDSPLGKTTRKISFVLIYFKEDLKKAYNLLKNSEGDLSQFNEPYEKVKNEIEKWKKDFEKNSEYFPKPDVYFYYFSPKYKISSILSTFLSLSNPEKTFILVADYGQDFLTLSARNNVGKRDMGELLKKGIGGLEKATAGGHISAAGGTISKKDLNKFKNNILK